MRKDMKRRLIAILVMIAVGLCGCASDDNQEEEKKGLESNEVFSIQDEVCTLPEARVVLTNYQNMYATMYGIDLWDHEFEDDELETYVKDLTISRLAQIITMDFLAESNGILLTEEEKAATKDAAEEYYNSLNDAEREYMEVKQSDIENLYIRYGLANKLYTHLTGGVNEEISDDEARIMEAQQIFVAEEEKAADIEQQLKDGADFLSLANANNESAETEITFGRQDVPPEVEKVVFSLENDQVSEKIKTDKGYYFIKCINHYDQEKTDDNKAVILENRRKEAFDDVYGEFVKKLTARFNERAWRKVKIKVKDDVKTDSFFEVYEKYCNW